MSRRGSKPDHIDRLVAARLGARRRQLDLDPRLVDAAIGEAPGTVETFEAATRRIGAAQLFRLATVLGTDVSYFYKETEAMEPPAAAAPPARPSTATGGSRQASEAQRFARAFAALPDEELRRSVRALIETLAESTVGDAPGADLPIIPWPSDDADPDDMDPDADPEDIDPGDDRDT